MHEGWTYPSLAELQDDINKIVVLKETVETHNVLMFKTTMNGDFLGHFVFLVGLDQKLLRDYLASKDMPSVNVGQLIAFCKTTLHN